MAEMNKKILLISSNSSSRGGGERYLIFMASGLIEIGCTVHVLLSSEPYMDGWAEEISNIGAYVHRLSLKGLVRRPLRFVQALMDIRQRRLISKFCASLQPDLILVNQQYDEDGLEYIAGALASNVCQVAGVIHMPMAKGKNDRPLGRLRGALLGFWYANSKHTIVFTSAGACSEFFSYYRIKRNAYIVSSGLPLADKNIRVNIRSATQKDSIKLERKPEGALKVIGVACQFVEQKNIHGLISVWLDLLESQTITRLLLIGDGPQRREIEQRLAAVDRDLWEITGWTAEYRQYLCELDLFVMPSLFESMPLALVEAAGLGVSCIVSGFNGAAEIASRASWVYVLDKNTSTALFEAIQDRLADNVNLPTSDDLDAYRSYFSTKRMAKDFIDTMSKVN